MSIPVGPDDELIDVGLPVLIDHVMVTGAQPAPIASLTVEIASTPGQPARRRVRRHALSATLLGDDLEARRARLRATLPIRRVVDPADIAAPAVHIMTNTALTGATYDVENRPRPPAEPIVTIAQ
jgi:NAD(P)-dependent dehydrogenase (short-subunit alcohol dehydrogenase family)